MDNTTPWTPEQARTGAARKATASAGAAENGEQAEALRSGGGVGEQDAAPTEDDSAWTDDTLDLESASLPPEAPAVVPSEAAPAAQAEAAPVEEP